MDDFLSLEPSHEDLARSQLPINALRLGACSWVLAGLTVATILVLGPNQAAAETASSLDLSQSRLASAALVDPELATRHAIHASKPATSPSSLAGASVDDAVLIALAPATVSRPEARPDEAFFRPHIRPANLLLPDPPTSLHGATELQCLAVAIYHEARNQSLDGQLAVASVILNRAREPERWGARPCDVVVPGQFSFLSETGSFPKIEKNEAWAIAVEMAREALERGPSSLVGKADHYHTPAVHPYWNDRMEFVTQIGGHIFYADATGRG